MSVSPEDAEVLASRRFRVEELCRCSRCRPRSCRITRTTRSPTQRKLTRWIALADLSPVGRKIEAEFQPARCSALTARYSPRARYERAGAGRLCGPLAGECEGRAGWHPDADEVREAEEGNRPSRPPRRALAIPWCRAMPAPEPLLLERHEAARQLGISPGLAGPASAAPARPRHPCGSGAASCGRALRLNASRIPAHIILPPDPNPNPNPNPWDDLI